MSLFYLKVNTELIEAFMFWVHLFQHQMPVCLKVFSSHQTHEHQAEVWFSFSQESNDLPAMQQDVIGYRLQKKAKE